VSLLHALRKQETKLQKVVSSFDVRPSRFTHTAIAIIVRQIVAQSPVPLYEYICVVSAPESCKVRLNVALIQKRSRKLYIYIYKGVW
jgi:hypothetical protein